jgi:DNA-binding GntR family transcriptional regulator
VTTKQDRISTLAPRRSIRDTVTSTLRGAIIAGEMAPGEVYSAPTLAAQFGVSPTPVRESMVDLAKEGLVEPVRNKGFRVTQPTTGELDEIAKIRLLLEPPSVHDITLQVPEKDFPLLRSMAQAIVDAATEGDLVGYLDADRTFHLKLLSYTGNGELSSLISDLRNRTRLFGLKSLSDAGALIDSAEEHHQILDAVESRDPARAEAEMTHHINHVRGKWADVPEETAVGN